MFLGEHGFAVPVWRPMFHISHQNTENLRCSYDYGKGHCIVCTRHGLALTGIAAQQIILTRACPKSITS